MANSKNHPVPTIEHTINGYSRYQLPETVAFSASAGVLYPARVEFLNPRECRYISVGGVVRAEAMTHPSFTPFRVRLHRYFCPMQLYHPEMRVNSSGFDMASLSTNLLYVANRQLQATLSSGDIGRPDFQFVNPRSLLSFLGLSSGITPVSSGAVSAGEGAAPTGSVEFGGTPVLGSYWVNADPVLAYYDIIRNYYGFSQLDLMSFAVPSFVGESNVDAFGFPAPRLGATASSPKLATQLAPNVGTGYWNQYIGKLTPLDRFFETSFYPSGSSITYFDRTGQILRAFAASVTPSIREYPLESVFNSYIPVYTYSGQGPTASSVIPVSMYAAVASRLPFGVAPSMADRLSRLLRPETVQDVSIANLTTVRQLAVAAKTQAYRDLIAAGGSRFTDWVKTFFAADVKHVDRPVLVYSSSFYLNSNPIFNQTSEGLGDYAGVLEGQDTFGKRAQRYCFQEPGYLIDLFSIQPLYYWSGVRRDYASYDKMDYFNPIFNEIGYQTLPAHMFGSYTRELTLAAVAKEPAFNEFRASYDRVLGDLATVPGVAADRQLNKIKSSWVQQRSPIFYEAFSSVPFVQDYLNKAMFVDVNQANSVFSSTVEDNFYVNLYYSVSSKSLVSKNFATNLSTR